MEMESLDSCLRRGAGSKGLERGKRERQKPTAEIRKTWLIANDVATWGRCIEKRCAGGGLEMGG